MVAAAGVGYFLTGRPVHEEYRTAVGEQRSITLADHSMVNLNTDTALDVTLSKDLRRVDLHHGEVEVRCGTNDVTFELASVGEVHCDVAGVTHDVAWYRRGISFPCSKSSGWWWTSATG